ncbi:hypothetical protein ACFOLF_33010 [Paenibacillus sepulcri]|uniref:hypothetical protein n=1 Tax=Paenibacillus sepulcri TaxID=359917 RepID=UPI001AE8B2B7
MSKGRVWNKGKHNGGGGKSDRSGSIAPAASTEANAVSGIQTGAAEGASEVPDTRGNRVMRMNRENWVERPARVVPRKKPDAGGSAPDDSKNL